jgi:hypothetical protein
MVMIVHRFVSQGMGRFFNRHRQGLSHAQVMILPSGVALTKHTSPVWTSAASGVGANESTDGKIDSGHRGGIGCRNQPDGGAYASAVTQPSCVAALETGISGFE